jgi:hypothetical protein
MKPMTKSDMMRLQTYGAYYLSGIEPANIENMVRSPSLAMGSLEQALGTASGEGQVQNEQQRAAGIVQVVFSTVASIIQVVSVAFAPLAVVGAVFGIVGGIISAVMRRQAAAECDSRTCLDQYTDPENARTDTAKKHRAEKRSRHIRAAVGINVSSDAEQLNRSDCRVKHYGGTKSQCESKWGLFSTYMNDGMWWWGKVDAFKHQDCLSGTVIGVKGRVDSGATKNCHRRMYGNPETPVLAGMAGKPHSDADLSPEFLARQEAVTQVLQWMAADSATRKRRTAGLDYELLSCFQQLFRRHVGGDDYRVSTQSSLIGDEYQEGSIAHFMGVSEDTYNFGSGATPYNMRIASRIYASIRAMFQGAVAMSRKLGEERAIELLAEVIGKHAVFHETHSTFNTDALKWAIRGQKSNTEPWPERPLAMVLGFQDLKEFLRLLAHETAVRVIEAQIGKQRAIMAADAAVQGQPAGFGYGVQYSAVVRRRMQELATNPRSLGAGGLGKFSPWRIPQWLIYTGAGALVAGGIYGLIRAIREED